MKLAIVVSHPIQTFCPLYRRLAAEPNLDLRVFFASRAGVDGYYDPGFNQHIQWSRNLLDGFQSEFLPGAAGKKLAGPIDAIELGARLEVFDPDAVQFYGFYHGLSRRSLLWALWRRRCSLLVSDSTLRTPRTRSHRLRKVLTVPPALALVDACLTVGDSNEAYYRHYGAPRRKLFRSPLPVDEDSLTEAIQRRGQLRKEIRDSLGISLNALVVLVVSKLTAKKAPRHAIEALAGLVGSGSPDLQLVFAGAGAEQATLQALANHELAGRVHFPGFVRVNRLPAFYVASDILLHPSAEDAHPLATSEAVFCGLPVIVSDRVGSVGPTDDVRPGENGVEYPFGNIGELRDAIRLLMDSQRREAFGSKSLAIGRSRGLAASVDGYSESAQDDGP